MSNTLAERDDVQRAVAQALDLAARLGADQAEAGASTEQGLSVTVRLGEVETLEYQRDRGLGVTVYFGNRKGSASTADLAEQTVRETVEKACSIARFTAEDECAGLADPEMMASEIPDLDLFHPWDIDAEHAIDLARACESAGRGVDKRINNSEGASISSHSARRVYGNSHGFLHGFQSTSHSASCAMLASQDDHMERDYWYTSARDAADMEDVESVGRRAGARTVRRLGARKLATARVPVLFPPELARGLIGHFTAAVRGGAQYRGSSFLLKADGEQIFPEWIDLKEWPHLQKAMASAPFDSEGVATRDRTLVQDGVLRGYLLDSYSARKLGLQTTGSAGGLHNLVVTPRQTMSPEAMLQKMGTGLLIGELMGQGVNGVTGDYSRGAAGFWVENGEIMYPVHEITVAGNLRDIYRGIQAVGDDLDSRGAIHSGSILIDQMMVAGDQ
ncbi:MAG: metalloprotease PmbA [Gammaproteobacteria bacterium]|nr:metalloprotease PmbA [Gammaproteobacteria bacterium]